MSTTKSPTVQLLTQLIGEKFNRLKKTQSGLYQIGKFQNRLICLNRYYRPGEMSIYIQNSQKFGTIVLVPNKNLIYMDNKPYTLKEWVENYPELDFFEIINAA
jgi:hypothetical protein